MIEIGWLMQVSKALKKLHHLQFLIDWLPPLAINWPPLLPSQIDTFQTKAGLHPIQLLSQLEITCLNRIHCDLADTTFVLRIRWIWLESQMHAKLWNLASILIFVRRHISWVIWFWYLELWRYQQSFLIMHPNCNPLLGTSLLLFLNLD